MKQGDILLLVFPFTDLSSTKVRPALLVSSNSFNMANSDLIFALITSNTSRVQPEDIVVRPPAPDFASTGLKVPSLIRVGRIHALSKELVRRRLGRASARLLDEIKANLHDVFDLS